MTKKILAPLFVIALAVTGCTNPSGGNTPEEYKSFNAIKSAILSKHNYTAHVYAEYDETHEKIADARYYNINNDALYSDASEYMYTGYIRQKNQGFILFQMLKTGSAVIPGYFVATNTNLGVSDIYTLAIENLVNADFSQEEDNTFVARNAKAVAVAANLALGDFVVYCSAPENNEFKVTVAEDFSSITVEAKFVYNYQDVSEGSLDDTFKQAPLTVSITIDHIGSTRNSAIEAYIANPDTTFSNPTDWDDGVKTLFKNYYNNYIPPFMEGLSYSWRYGEDVSEGKVVARVEDYASGDLTSRYSTLLVNNGYVKSGNEYIKTVQDDANKVVHKYYVKMSYYAPTQKDASGMEYGYLYPNGVFSVKFLYKGQTLEEVTTVGLLNSYLSNTDAGSFIPQLGLDENIKVSNFSDNTYNSNNAGNGEIYAFVAPNRTSYFNVHIEDYSSALAFVNSYKASCESKGFTFQSAMGASYGTDEYGSIIRITDVASVSSSSWSSIKKVQMQYVILKESVAHDSGSDPEGQLYNIYTASNPGATIDVSMPASRKAKEGNQVIFKVTVTDGYQLNGVVVKYGSDKTVAVTGPNLSTGAYTFDMPAADVTIHAITSASGGGETTKYEVKLDSVTGAAIEVTSHSNRMAAAGETVTFKVHVSSGYTLESVLVKASNGNEVRVSGNVATGSEFSFTMPSCDVLICPTVSQSSTPGGDTGLVVGAQYKLAYNQYVDMILTFGRDGTGTYIKYRNNNSTTESTLSFKYSVNGDKITVTLVSGSASDFPGSSSSRLRLFYGSEVNEVNDTGKINADGTISFDMYGSDGETTKQTFSK